MVAVKESVDRSVRTCSRILEMVSDPPANLAEDDSTAILIPTSSKEMDFSVDPVQSVPREFLAVILAGFGNESASAFLLFPWYLLSTRLLPLTGDIGDVPFPKALLPISNRPMVDYVLSWVEQSGIKGTTRSDTISAHHRLGCQTSFSSVPPPTAPLYHTTSIQNLRYPHRLYGSTFSPSMRRRN